MCGINSGLMLCTNKEKLIISHCSTTFYCFVRPHIETLRAKINGSTKLRQDFYDESNEMQDRIVNKCMKVNNEIRSI